MANPVYHFVVANRSLFPSRLAPETLALFVGTIAKHGPRMGPGADADQTVLEALRRLVRREHSAETGADSIVLLQMIERVVPGILEMGRRRWRWRRLLTRGLRRICACTPGRPSVTPSGGDFL